MALTERVYFPTHMEPSRLELPAKGPAWLIEPTRHVNQQVGYDANSLRIPHYESGRLYGYYRSTIQLDCLRPAEPLPVASRLATAAAHCALGEHQAGYAIADLCVVGRGSLRQLGSSRLTDEIDWSAVAAQAQQAPLLPGIIARRQQSHQRALAPPAAADVEAVIGRAQDVYQQLRTPGPRRRNLGWIAVSGEDDLPRRPVNVMTTAHPQHDATLQVWGHPLQIRYAQAGVLTSSSKNVLLLHGHSSHLEEVEHVMTALEEKGYVVLALDLPSSGYSEQLDHKELLFWEPATRDVPLPFAREKPLLTNHSSLFVLRFLQACVHAFVDWVFAQEQTPARIDLLAGGSLGGNLALLFAESIPAGNPDRHPWVNRQLTWVGKIACWSPACLWQMPSITHGLPHSRSHEIEDEGRRRDHLNRWMNVDYIGPIGIRQAEQWYRKGWPDKGRALAECWLYRHETYSPRFRQWHWMLAHEQLKFSHQKVVLERDGTQNRQGKKYYELAAGDLLLMAGDGDNFRNTTIYDRVRKLGPKIPAHGLTLLWKDTGHSIQDERPGELATVLDRFVQGTL